MPITWRRKPHCFWWISWETRDSPQIAAPSDFTEKADNRGMMCLWRTVLGSHPLIQAPWGSIFKFQKCIELSVFPARSVSIWWCMFETCVVNWKPPWCVTFYSCTLPRRTSFDSNFCFTFRALCSSSRSVRSIMLVVSDHYRWISTRLYLLLDSPPEVECPTDFLIDNRNTHELASGLNVESKWNELHVRSPQCE